MNNEQLLCTEVEPSTATMGSGDGVIREDIDYLTIGNTTYEIASVYDGKATLLDIVKSSLKRSAQQALRQMEKS